MMMDGDFRLMVKGFCFGGNRTTDILEYPDLVNFTVVLQKKLKVEASDDDDDDDEADEGDEAEEEAESKQ
jgi:hypothetical protein